MIDTGGINLSVLEAYINNTLYDLNTLFIGEIVGIDVKSQKYTVQPIMKSTTETGEYIQKALIVNCPYSYSRTGNFIVANSFAIGDYVYLGVNKNNIDMLLDPNSKNIYASNSISSFRLVDGIILGGLSKKGESFDFIEPKDYIIYNRANGSYVTLKESGDIVVNATNNVIVNSIDATINASGTANINSPETNVNSPVANFSGDVNIAGNIGVSKNLSVKGNSSGEGSMVISGNITGGGISLTTHVHGGVMTGGGTTQGPQ